MPSTLERSLVKGIVWEFISFVITAIAVYIFYGNFSIAIKFSLVLTGIKVIFFFMHERTWKKVKWGKYEIQNVKMPKKRK